MGPSPIKRRRSSELDAAALAPADAVPSEAAMESEAATEELPGAKRKASPPASSSEAPEPTLDGNDADGGMNPENTAFFCTSPVGSVAQLHRVPRPPPEVSPFDVDGERGGADQRAVRLAEAGGTEAGEEQEQEAAANGDGAEGDAAMQDAPHEGDEVGKVEEDKVGEDAGAKVESLACLAHGCGGAVALSADLLRFGHGVRARCSGSKECHRFKWCNRLYLLVAVEEWPVHQSWCAGNRTDHTVPLDAELLKDAEPEPNARPDDAKTEGTEGGSEEPAKTEEGEVLSRPYLNLARA